MIIISGKQFLSYVNGETFDKSWNRFLADFGRQIWDSTQIH